MIKIWELIRYSTVMMYLHNLAERVGRAIVEAFSKETFMQLLYVLRNFGLTTLHILITPVSFSKHRGIHRYNNGNGTVSAYEMSMAYRIRYVGVHHKE